MTKDEALKLSMEAMEITGGFDVEINAIKEALADPSPNFNCKSVQARLATAWGYVKAQPEQEPVACVTYKEVADTMNGLWGGTLVQRQIAEELENTMLYTTPPQRKPLSDEEIDELRSGYQSGRIGSFVSLARAIEQAHGIKELKEYKK